MSSAELNFPMEQICGREASLSFAGEDPRICRLPIGHAGAHKFPPRRPTTWPTAPDTTDAPAGPGFAVQLLEVLGIDPSHVVELRLQAVPERMPTVTVSLLVPAAVEGQVLAAARRYRLVVR